MATGLRLGAHRFDLVARRSLRRTALFRGKLHSITIERSLLTSLQVMGKETTHCRTTQSIFCVSLVVGSLISTICQLWLLHRVFVVSYEQPYCGVRGPS